MKNLDIRQKCKVEGIRLWEIAEHMSVCDMTLSRKMRHELPQAEKERVFAIIEAIKAERDKEVV